MVKNYSSEIYDDVGDSDGEEDNNTTTLAIRRKRLLLEATDTPFRKSSVSSNTEKKEEEEESKEGNGSVDNVETIGVESYYEKRQWTDDFINVWFPHIQQVVGVLQDLFNNEDDNNDYRLDWHLLPQIVFKASVFVAKIKRLKGVQKFKIVCSALYIFIRESTLFRGEGEEEEEIVSKEEMNRKFKEISGLIEMFIQINPFTFKSRKKYVKLLWSIASNKISNLIDKCLNGNWCSWKKQQQNSEW